MIFMPAANHGIFGAGAFSYVFTTTPKGGGTAWIIEFYENVAFLPLSGDPNHPDLQEFPALQSTGDLGGSGPSLRQGADRDRPATPYPRLSDSS